MPALSDRALALIDFFTAEVGRPTTVFHDTRETAVHVDVHVVPPAPGRPRYTLFTTGMSDMPMTGAPPCDCCPDRSELVMALPESWPLPTRCPRCEPNAEPEPGRLWPVELMRDLALYPHDGGRYFGWRHTMSYDVPVGDTRFGGVVFLPPALGPLSLMENVTVAEEPIRLLAPVLLYPRELQLARRGSTDVILERLFEADVTELVDESRPELARPELARPEVVERARDRVSNRPASPRR